MYVILRQCYDEGFLFWAYDDWRPVTISNWTQYAEAWPVEDKDEAEAKAKWLGRGAFVSWEDVDFNDRLGI